MLVIHKNISTLKYSSIMKAYEEDLIERAYTEFPTMSVNESLHEVEQDYYQYLSENFFQTPHAFMATWEENEQYIACLRMEPYEDGMLLSGLMTSRENRRKGYATNLLSSVLKMLPVGMKIYSHVNKENLASNTFHNNFGFSSLRESSLMLDGALLHNFRTYLYEI